jgi:hypothetical protein
VFSERKQTGLPTASKISLAGLATGNARLSFRLRSGANAPSISSFTISLPHGLSFNKDRKQLTQGLAVTDAGKYTFTTSHGNLIVTLSKAAHTPSVMIRAHSLIESKSLINSVQRVINFNRAKKHRKKRAVALPIGVRVSDAKHKVTHLVLRIKVM